MAIIRRAELDMVGFNVGNDVSRQGAIALRWRKMTYDGETLISTEPHRANIEPGDDIDAIVAQINANLSAMGFEPTDGDTGWIKYVAEKCWTPEIIAATAARKAEESAAAALSQPPAPDAATRAKQAVEGHALALKIGAVNALRTDGGEPYPVSPESLAMIRQTYADTLNEIQADALLNGGATDAQKQTVGLIKAGFDFMRAVDAAAAAIIAAGDGADPIASDQRWPTLS